MAPTPTPTPTPKSIYSFKTPSRTTPKSRSRLHFNSAKTTHPSPNPNATPKQTPPTDHPIEVLGRIRDHPDQKEKPTSALQISSDGCTVQVRTEIGYRNFTLDGVSVSEEEDLDEFYKKFIKSRITGVKLGDKCTIMMYGPTGAGKSHTMFGSAKQPGIVYRALKDILGEDEDENLGFGSFVQVSVLEIYNEEIYDLLANGNGGGLGLGWPKGNASKVRLEVMGKKAKNATVICGNDAGNISKDVAKVEKRRIVKSTLCNDRSSRSHCMIILDVPTVGGRLMLVDMAGSENIEQAGQVGFEAKMQTAKINQGNIALKRVVESIANGDSHVPFRDSKLTMLLQDSFEDDNTKILMILCASPDPKEMHKTISTLEYGAKAKCILRGRHTPDKDKLNSEHGSSSVALGSRIAAMDQFINQLQMENKRREKEHNEAQKELIKKEEEVAALRIKLELMEKRKAGGSEEDINLKIKEREQVLKLELEKKLQECQKMADEFVEMGKRRMEEKILQQQQELKLLRRRLEELESELRRSRDKTGDELYAHAEKGMERLVDSNMEDQQLSVKEDDNNINAPKFPEKVYLSTVLEEEGHDKDNVEDEEVEKVVVEESAHASRRTNDASPGFNIGKYSLVHTHNEQKTKSYTGISENADCYGSESLEKGVGLGLMDKLDHTKDPTSSRRTRIQNIFLLCGNHRELAQQVRVQTPNKRKSEAADLGLSPAKVANRDSSAKTFLKENSPLRTSPVPEFGHLRKVLSDMTMANFKENLGSGSAELNSAESELKRSRVFIESTQDLKENIRPY